MIPSELTCSVVIPCYNEVDNVGDAIRRIPAMGLYTEVIVVDDGSTDGTGDAVRRLLPHHSHLRLISYTSNRGKGYAVKRGFEAARGDILLILDADLSVPPEDLPRFVEPLVAGKARFVNGTRLVYPSEPGAMGMVNKIGNHIFSRILSLLIGHPITDSLCGTKALFREDFVRISMQDTSWGDFDLLCGAALLNLPLVEVPVHYRRRVVGTSKMRPFKHGLILLKVCAGWFVKLKLGKGSRGAVRRDRIRFRARDRCEGSHLPGDDNISGK